MAVYFTMYTLLPRFLEKRELAAFLFSYLIMLMLCGLLQRVFTHFFYDGAFDLARTPIFSVTLILRSIILINSTVIFVSAAKIVKLWYLEQDKNRNLLEALQSKEVSMVEIKAEKRTFRVNANEILYIEALGNYVKVVLQNQNIISYLSLKQMLTILPQNFIRVHKSFVVNRDHVKSYNHEDIQVGESFIPIGRSYRSEFNI